MCTEWSIPVIYTSTTVGNSLSSQLSCLCWPRQQLWLGEPLSLVTVTYLHHFTYYAVHYEWGSAPVHCGPGSTGAHLHWLLADGLGAEDTDHPHAYQWSGMYVTAYTGYTACLPPCGSHDEAGEVWLCSTSRHKVASLPRVPTIQFLIIFSWHSHFYML